MASPGALQHDGPCAYLPRGALRMPRLDPAGHHLGAGQHVLGSRLKYSDREQVADAHRVYLLIDLGRLLMTLLKGLPATLPHSFIRSCARVPWQRRPLSTWALALQGCRGRVHSAQAIITSELHINSGCVKLLPTGMFRNATGAQRALFRAQVQSQTMPPPKALCDTICMLRLSCEGPQACEGPQDGSGGQLTRSMRPLRFSAPPEYRSTVAPKFQFTGRLQPSPHDGWQLLRSSHMLKLSASLLQWPADSRMQLLSLLQQQANCFEINTRPLLNM